MLFCIDQPKHCSGEIVLALVNLWSIQRHFLSEMAKILFIMLYQSVRYKIIMGCVTFPGYVALASLGNFTQTDVVYRAGWVKLYVNLHYGILSQF